MMKIFFIIVIIAVVVFYFYPAGPDSSLSQIKSSVLGKIESIGKSRVDYEEELRYKTAEFETYQQALAKIDDDIQRWHDEAPICPTTGQKAVITITQDPRSELREKIKKVEEEIASLKNKIH